MDTDGKTISIIIPTYNRWNLLSRTLVALSEQTYSMDNVEILVVDDASNLDGNTEEEKIWKNRDLNVRFYRNKRNIGQGLSRNWAIDEAKGRYLLFLGDDTIPDKDLLKEHMCCHKRNPKTAVLGKVVWADEVRDEFMNFIEKIQFHYQTIKDPNNATLHFYTSNISLDKKWFFDDRYSSEFNNYGLEDIELGYRLEKRGLRIIYNSKAVVHHVHHYDLFSFCDRMYKVGRSAVVFGSLHPELKRKFIPTGWRIMSLGSLVLSHRMIGSKRLYWYAKIVHSYFKGVIDQSASQHHSLES